MRVVCFFKCPPVPPCPGMRMPEAGGECHPRTHALYGDYFRARPWDSARQQTIYRHMTGMSDRQSMHIHATFWWIIRTARVDGSTMLKRVEISKAPRCFRPQGSRVVKPVEALHDLRRCEACRCACHASNSSGCIGSDTFIVMTLQKNTNDARIIKDRWFWLIL